MIQRIQTLLLAAAIVLNLVSLFLPAWQYVGVEEQEVISAMSVTASYQGGASVQSEPFYLHGWQIAWVSFAAAATLVLGWSIFLFNKRPFQIRIVYLGTMLLMLEILSLILFTRNGPFILGVSGTSEAAFGIFFPLVALPLTLVAARRIKADEDLVRSADRLR